MDQINSELHAEALQMGVQTKLDMFVKMIVSVFFVQKVPVMEQVCVSALATIQENTLETIAPSHMSAANVMVITINEYVPCHQMDKKTHQPLSNLGTCQVNQKEHNAIVNKDIVNPINVKALHHWLRGYDSEKLNYLVKGFTFGFPIPYSMGQRRYRYSINLKSANDNLNILKQKVEVVFGRMWGPFTVDNLPFDNLQIAPLGLVPKQKPGEYRIIPHLSYPDGLSINDDIAKEDSAVACQTIDDAVTVIKQFGKGELLSNTDIEHGYTYSSC